MLCWCVEDSFREVQYVTNELCLTFLARQHSAEMAACKIEKYFLEICNFQNINKSNTANER